MNNVPPRVSVVVPCYQNARFIERTIESVLSQSFSDFELIISDHSSTDGTWEIVQKYASDTRVHLVRVESGGGAERNWNSATEAARGEYVKVLCGDDLIYPDCLARQVETLDKNPNVGIAAVQRDLIDIHDSPLLKARGLMGLNGPIAGTVAIRAIVRAGTNLLGEPGCVLIRTEYLRKVGGWSAAYPFLIDQYTCMRILECADLMAISEPHAAFRLSNTQWSVHLATEQASQAHGVHMYFRQHIPNIISRWDMTVGSVRAFRVAWMRRGAYFVWRNRMKDHP